MQGLAEKFGKIEPPTPYAIRAEEMEPASIREIKPARIGLIPRKTLDNLHRYMRTHESKPLGNMSTTPMRPMGTL